MIEWKAVREAASRFLAKHKEKKGPTPKQFDDDEVIRSLTEAQEITTDVELHV